MTTLNFNSDEDVDWLEDILASYADRVQESLDEGEYDGLEERKVLEKWQRKALDLFDVIMKQKAQA